MMLNRKISNYLFYFVLITILGVVILVRVVTIGNIDDKIADLKRNNIYLQAQIEYIEEIVEDNNDIQISHLYELYNQVPSSISNTELSNYVTALLELVGISENSDMERSVLLNQEVTFSEGTPFFELQNEFQVVEVRIFFSILAEDDSVVEDLINLLFNSDQIFIIHNIEYLTPNIDNYIDVSIDFLAFYEKIDES